MNQLIAFCLLSLYVLVPQQSTSLIFHENFEVYNFVPEGKKAPRFGLQKVGQSISAEVGACEGVNAVRFHVDPAIENDNFRVRSMLMLKPHPDNYGHFGNFGTFDTTKGEEFWYGFAIYVPEAWDTTALVWQEKAGLNYARYSGDTGVRSRMNPPVSIHIETDDGKLRWKYKVKADPKMIEGPNDAVEASQAYMGLVKKNDWNSFVIHANYTHTDQGSITFWVNDKIYEYHGRTVVAPEGFRDKQRIAAEIPFDYADPFNFSFGIYKPEWRQTPGDRPYTLYFDAFRVGGKDSSYEEVRPRCDSFNWQRYFLPIIIN